jgi:hypothetical protein
MWERKCVRKKQKSFFLKLLKLELHNSENCLKIQVNLLFAGLVHSLFSKRVYFQVIELTSNS